ncbi:MAG: iron ABC transporter permease [Legionellales bacterium]|jgi:iron(III) transport system permease protein
MTRQLLTALAILTSAIMLLPFIGLLSGLINPPENPLAPATQFLELISQSDLWVLLGRTILLGLTVSVLSVFFGTYLAYLLVRTRYFGHRLLALMGLMSLAMPSYILAATLRDILSAYFTGYFPVLLTLVVITIPYVQLLVSASLMRLSSSEEEAARTLGATTMQIFFKIILPHARPSIALAFLITILYTISEFGAVSVLNYPVLTWRLYQAVDHQQLSQAILLGASLLALGIPLFILSRLLHGEVPSITQLANPKQASHITLSPLALFVAYSAHAIMIGIGVILPVIVLGTWVYAGLAQHLTFAPLNIAVWDSLRIALFAASIIVLLSFAPAWLATRRTKIIGRLIEQTTYLSSALPGILLAFGLMLMALYLARFMNSTNLYTNLLHSGILLIIGYTLCFLSQAYTGVKTAILKLDPRQYDTAKTLGASNLRYFFKIALPNLKPGIATAFVLVFLAVLKELPVTLLLGGAMGLRPLSYRVFDRYQEAFLHDAGFAGLVLLLLSFTMMAIVLRWRSHV